MLDPSKPIPSREQVVRQLSRREREMLPDPRKVDEPQVDDLDPASSTSFFTSLGDFDTMSLPC